MGFKEWVKDGFNKTMRAVNSLTDRTDELTERVENLENRLDKLEEEDN